MFARKTFVRRLPQGLDEEDRLKIESLVYALDQIEYNFQRLREIAVSRSIDVDPSDTASLFSHAWSIVDGIHVVRQLFQLLAGKEFSGSPKLKSFYEAWSCATKLRNKMDHLHEQIPNLARARKVRPPLFGALSYFLVLPEDLREENGRQVAVGGHSIVLTGSTRQREVHTLPLATPTREFSYPASSFQLLAFDSSFHIEDVVLQLFELVEPLADAIEKSVMNSLQEACQKHGVPIESMLQPSGGAIVMRARIDFIRT